MNKKLKIVLWIGLLIGVLVLMSFVKKAHQEAVLNVPMIFIDVDDENAFLTQDELYSRILSTGLYKPGMQQQELALESLEKYVADMTEVRDVKLYSNLGKDWNIDVKLRRPIARIYNKYDESFYMDETGFLMKTSDLYTARVVVVTGEIEDRMDVKNIHDFINNDSLKSIRILDDIYRISTYVCKDAFLRAQIGQIHRKKNGDFVLIPQVGGQVIIFGTAKTDEDVAQKFEKLSVFYKEGIPFEGWTTYSEINLKYDGQIVCKRKD